MPPLDFVYSSPDPGAEVFGLAADGDYVAGGCQEGIFTYSTNAGVGWTTYPTTTRPWVDAGAIFAVTILDSTVIVGGYSRTGTPSPDGLATTTDNGSTWYVPADDPFQGITFGPEGVCYALTVCAGTIFAGGRPASGPHRLFYSSDVGATWAPTVADPFYGLAPTSNVFALTTIGATLYAAGQGGSTPIAYSNDLGHTWSYPSNVFDTNSVVRALAVGGTGFSPVLVAGGYFGSGNSGIAISTDLGASFTFATNPPMGDGVFALAADSSILVCGGSGTPPSIASSMDNGATWTTASFDPFASGGECDSLVITSGHVVAGGTNTVGGDHAAYSIVPTVVTNVFRQFPRDDRLAVGTTRQPGIGPSPSSRQNSIRQGISGTYS